MDPLTKLMSEHRRIQQVLSCLERIANEANEQGRLDTDAAGKALDFLRHYADKVHHAKEEDRLFPVLEAKGFSPDEGPTAVMRYEHQVGRGHIGAMFDHLDAAGAGDAMALHAFSENALDYIDLLRVHITKEDHCLFPMAADALAAADMEGLTEQFVQADERETGLDTIVQYESLAEELGARYGVPLEPLEAS
jgi:hemerythrin-like domain-containing protein